MREVVIFDETVPASSCKKKRRRNDDPEERRNKEDIEDCLNDMKHLADLVRRYKKGEDVTEEVSNLFRDMAVRYVTC